MISQKALWAHFGRKVFMSLNKVIREIESIIDAYETKEKSSFINDHPIFFERYTVASQGMDILRLEKLKSELEDIIGRTEKDRH